MVDLNEALAFTGIVHDAQRSEQLWLADHPFVQAVRAGSARRSEIELWVRQVHVINGIYREILEALSPQEPAEAVEDARRDHHLLIQLGEALGITGSVMERSEPNSAAQSVNAWLRQQLTPTDEQNAGQVCWALAEAMSPETGDYLAEGAEKHFGLTGDQLQYFTVGMKAKAGADAYAAKMLSRVSRERWETLQEQALVLSRLLVSLYHSVGDMWSAW